MKFPECVFSCREFNRKGQIVIAKWPLGKVEKTKYTRCILKLHANLSGFEFKV